MILPKFLQLLLITGSSLVDNFLRCPPLFFLRHSIVCGLPSMSLDPLHLKKGLRGGKPCRLPMASSPCLLFHSIHVFLVVFLFSDVELVCPIPFPILTLMVVHLWNDLLLAQLVWPNSVLTLSSAHSGASHYSMSTWLLSLEIYSPWCLAGFQICLFSLLLLWHGIVDMKLNKSFVLMMSFFVPSGPWFPRSRGIPVDFDEREAQIPG